MTEHYLPPKKDIIVTTRLGITKLIQTPVLLPSKFRANKNYWEKKEVIAGMLISGTYLDPFTGRQLRLYELIIE